MDSLTLLKGLRYIDSFFPSGGYAFSSGLEAAVQGGLVRDSKTLSRYVEDLLGNGLGRREAVAVARAWDAQARGAVLRQAQGSELSRGGGEAVEMDWELDSMNLSHETRMASRQMGRQVLKVAAEQRDAAAILNDYQVDVEAGRSPGHLAVSLGLTLGAAGWTREQTVAAFLYQSAVGLVSAALKLLPIGQREAQRLLESWAPLIARVSRDSEKRVEMTAWTPIQDIYAMRHSRLTSRLFRS
jgi:urease accessory protein